MNITSTVPAGSPTDLYTGVSPSEAAERQRVVSAIRTISQENLFGPNRELTFTLDRASRTMVINVVDRDTRETVMQLPPEYVLRLSASVQHGK